MEKENLSGTIRQQDDICARGAVCVAGSGCGVEKMTAWLPLLKVVSLGICCWLLSALEYRTKWTFDLIQ